MNITAIRSDRIYRKMMTAAPAEKDNIYRDELMKPFAFKWSCIGIPLKAETEENTLVYQGEKISLSKNEFRILHILMENKGRVVSREKLMERMWETDSFVDENTLTVNVGRLRKKLDNAGLKDFITTKFGVGYLIAN